MRLLVLPHARVRGWPNHPDAPHHCCHELGEALAREYASDAHFAAYAPNPLAPRRLTRKAVEHAPVVMVLLVWDVDDPIAHREHAPASEAWRESEAAKVAAMRDAHPDVVTYETRGGYRGIAVLPEAVTVATHADAAGWSQFYLRQLGYLSRRFDILADPACKDWQRLYRLPHATREGDHPEQRCVLGDLRHPGLWRRADDDAADLAELQRLAAEDPKWRPHARAVAAPAALASRTARPRTTRTAPPVIAADLGALGPLGVAVAEAIAQLPRGCGLRHGARLAVAASLLERGWSRAVAERVLGDVARALGKNAAAVVGQTVGSTAERLTAGQAVASDGWLREHAPLVLQALQAQAPRESPAVRWRRALDAVASPSEVCAEEGSAQVGRCLQRARDERALVIARVTAGAGKTFTAACHAAAAAARGERTVVLVPTHAVAGDVIAVLRDRGVATTHAMGPLSHRDATGAPTCTLHQAARSAADAGQDVLRTLCDGLGHPAPGRRYLRSATEHHAPCPQKIHCPAYAAARASLTGDVVVTVHALAGPALGWLREQPRGLVVVDEAPALVTSHGITADEARYAAGVLRGEAFARSERWRADLLEALARGLEGDGAAGCGSVRALLALGEGDDAVVAGWERRARFCTAPDGSERERERWAPRIGTRTLRRLREGRELPPETLEAARIAGVVAHALALQAPDRPTSPVDPQSRVIPRGYGPHPDALELRVVLPAEDMIDLVGARDVGRVFLDATADPRLVAQVLGERPQVVRVAVRDGTPVRRIFLPWSHATRRHCLGAEGVIRWEEVRGAVREAIALVLREVPRGGQITILTWRPLCEAFERAWSAGPDDRDDPEARALLMPLRDHEASLTCGYFGNLRGQNGWRGSDGLVVLGTPWPNMSAARTIARALGLEGAEEDVARHEAMAELEQAVGRLRAPRRETRATVVVAAAVPPLDADRSWEVRASPSGRPEKRDPHQLAALATEHGVRAAAQLAGVAPATVRAAQRKTASMGREETRYEGPSVTGSFPPLGAPRALRGL